ncbi:MAG: VanW family protein [Candidatus Moraniibacteriota bacterium]
MRNLIYCFILFISFFSYIPAVLAEDLDLGFFIENDLNNKLTTDLTVKVNDENYIIAQAELQNWLMEKNFLNFEKGYNSEIENNNFCLYKKSLICNLFFSALKQNHLRKKIFIQLNKDSLKQSIADLALKTNEDPVDARLKIIDGKVSTFSLSENGLALDENKSAEKIIDYLKNKGEPTLIELPYQEINPTVVTSNADEIKIDTLIGEGRSNFRGSPKNRIFNIKVATERFNGILIKPGEDFSFVRVLGEVDGEHGYLPELVIKKDKTEPEFGGGICQVSTTAFRAAIYSGLKITSRQNHAYPVSYYNPQGMDSTIYVPRPDLRFKNDTPGYILIQTKIEGTELIFQFYGTSDGRKTKVIGPTILEKNPDGSMKTTFTQEIYDKDDNLIREAVFNSSYDSPSKYPHPGSSTDLLSKKPKNWSDREWKIYRKEHNMP